jgi:hypothetical protein
MSSMMPQSGPYQLDHNPMIVTYTPLTRYMTAVVGRKEKHPVKVIKQKDIFVGRSIQNQMNVVNKQAKRSMRRGRF